MTGHQNYLCSSAGANFNGVSTTAVPITDLSTHMLRNLEPISQRSWQTIENMVLFLIPLYIFQFCGVFTNKVLHGYII